MFIWCYPGLFFQRREKTYFIIYSHGTRYKLDALVYTYQTSSLRFTALRMGTHSTLTLPLCIRVLVAYLRPSLLQETISMLVT